MDSLARQSGEKDVFMFQNLRLASDSGREQLWSVCKDKIDKPRGEQRRTQQIQVPRWND